jgi:hypothetical protein
MTDARLEVSRPRPLGDGRFLFAVLDDRGTALATVVCADRQICDTRIADLKYLLAIDNDTDTDTMLSDNALHPGFGR